jgi:hypothetical protein
LHRELQEWADTRAALAKGGVYNPVAPVPDAEEGHPELGQKAAKSAKLMGLPTERLQASLEKCMIDARTHAIARAEKFDASWKMMLKNQSMRIGLLKATTTAKKRNMVWEFLMAANLEVMDGKVQSLARHLLEEGEPAAAASSPTPMPISTPDTFTPSTAATPSPPEESVIVIADDEPTVANTEEVATIDEEPFFTPVEEAKVTAI